MPIGSSDIMKNVVLEVIIEHNNFPPQPLFLRYAYRYIYEIVLPWLRGSLIGHVGEPDRV